ncbi:hypothetical protein AKJ42_01900 [candidate division MSBL1 archaeon SCGC-AAA261C02]|uniref:Uncharacterized protein n=1 Tax=candidate division MSBL1 archaeon SCGC-AAA261C02 TaxID=1698272 RepID=A0A133V0Q2_9EURY|nr:hypothetical protein AKJ42_01900 [candidate division MSBL1 archaeon SCGC-AAA261C02]
MDFTILLMPGEFLARRFDSNYKKFAEKTERRGGVTVVGVLLEYSLAIMVGLITGLISLVWPVLVLLAAYPLLVMGEPWAWRKYYGQIARDVGVMGAFLANLDMIYMFAIGYLTGMMVL